MKKIFLSSLAAIAMIMAGCSNGEKFSDAVFVTGTLTNENVRFLVEGQSAMGLTVTSSAKATEDVKIEMAAAPELLDAYNSKTGKNYIAPPAEAYKIGGGDIVIKAGTNQSTAMSLECDGNKLAEGVAYCLPVTIKSVSGGLDIMETSRTAYVMFTKVIDIKVANLGGRGGFDIPGFWGEESPVRELKQMTLEMKVLPVSFPSSSYGDAGISSLCGCEENFLFRFGDGAGQPTNRLQLAKGSIGNPIHPDQKEHYEAWTDKYFDTGHWLHFAAVYDGKDIRLYLDGEQFFSKETKGGTINLSMAYEGHNWNDGFAIGRSVGYKRYFNGYNARPFGTVTYVEGQKCPY